MVRHQSDYDASLRIYLKKMYTKNQLVEKCIMLMRELHHIPTEVASNEGEE